ncbi:MAG: hypothetical protein EA398_15410 [Deltaproteobacteria bacterium]|nr:MAG: hypothetical protein EA398_15410 [Deltaproteobacteria bacterium]
MKSWSILPRDGALFRDARPFTGTAGAFSMPMPWPSTVAGFARSRIGMQPDGTFGLKPDDARQIAVQGPWLAELTPDGQVGTHLFPAPADAVFFPADAGHPNRLARRRIELLDPPESDAWLSDLPKGLRLAGFRDLVSADPGKPATGPAFWTARALGEWLARPTTADEVDASALGIPALDEDERIHVAIDPDHQTASDGKLFSTVQRHFVRAENGTIRQFGLVCRTDRVTHHERMGEGPGTLGGERRLSLVHALPDDDVALPLDDSISGPLLRIVLLTPGLFAEGFAPTRELGERASVVGACVPRFHAVSGWSFEHRGPKPSRRMAPAGSVYWLEFASASDARAWAEESHFTCLASDAQDARDGFGLIAVGNP